MYTIALEGDVSPYEIFAELGLQFDHMIRPQTTERYLYGGDSASFNFTIKSNGTAYNLNGASLSFSAKWTEASPHFLWNVTPTINSDPSTGRASATITVPGLTFGEAVSEVAVWTGGAKQTALQFPIYIGRTVA